MRKSVVILGLACALTLTAGLTACAATEFPQAGKDYLPLYSDAYSDPHDADMMIDGVLDEAVWQDADRKWLTYGLPQEEYYTEMSSVNTPFGVYLAVKVKDSDVAFESNWYLLKNTYCWIGVVPDRPDDSQNNQYYCFSVDMGGVRSDSGLHASGMMHREEDENGESEFSSTELFVSWEALGMDPAAWETNVVKSYLYYKSDSITTVQLFGGPYWVSTYCRFGKDGYLTDDEIAEGVSVKLGNSLLAGSEMRTSNWSVTDDGTTLGASTTCGYWQKLPVVMQFASSELYLEADVRIVRRISQSEGAASAAAGLYVDSGVQLMLNESGSVTYTDNSGSGVTARSGLNTADGVTLGLYFKDGIVYYLVEGEYVGYRKYDSAQLDKVSLFSAGCESAYTDVKFYDFKNGTDYYSADIAERIPQLIADEELCIVSVPDAVSGGTLSVSDYIVRRGDTVTVTVRGNQNGYDRGFVLSDIAVNGTSRLSDFKENAEGGVWELAVTEDTQISAAFENFESSTLSGSFMSYAGKQFYGTASIRSKDNPLLYYELSSSNSSFEIELPVKGSAWTASGEYVLTVEEYGREPVTAEFVLDENREYGPSDLISSYDAANKMFTMKNVSPQTFALPESVAGAYTVEQTGETETSVSFKVTVDESFAGSDWGVWAVKEGSVQEVVPQDGVYTVVREDGVDIVVSTDYQYFTFNRYTAEQIFELGRSCMGISAVSDAGKALPSIIFPSVSAEGYAVEYIGYNLLGNDTVNYAVNESVAAIALPKSVRSVGNGAFANMTELTTVVYTGEGLNLRGGAFYCSEKLSEMDLSKVTSLNNGSGYSAYVFCGCAALTDAVLSDQLTVLPIGTFQGCTNLRSVTLPSGLTEIQRNAFDGCVSLETLTIPASVTQFTGGEWFKGCDRLETLIMEGAMPSVPVTANPYDAFVPTYGVADYAPLAIYVPDEYYDDYHDYKHEYSTGAWWFWRGERCEHRTDAANYTPKLDPSLGGGLKQISELSDNNG